MRNLEILLNHSTAQKTFCDLAFAGISRVAAIDQDIGVNEGSHDDRVLLESTHGLLIERGGRLSVSRAEFDPGAPFQRRKEQFFLQG